MAGNPYAAYQNATQQSQDASVPSAGSPTFTEAWALIEAARRMAVAIEHSDLEDMKQRNQVREAVRLNWRLWTLFQAQLTVGDVDLPEDIRNNMLTLAKFIDNHTVETMKDLNAEKIAVLIDINRNIASGHLEAIDEAAKVEAAKQAEANPVPQQPQEPGEAPLAESFNAEA